jgi:MGT family glycosyltransferase
MSVRRFLFVVFAEAGHLNPMLAVGEHLERAGHEVVVFSLGDDVASRSRARGLRARCLVGNVSVTQAARTEAQRSLKMAQRLANPTWLKRLNERILVEILPRQADALAAAALDVRPDVVVADAMAYAAAAVADREGLPWASLATGLQSLVPAMQDTYADLAPKRAAATAALGASLRFRGSDAVSPWLDVMFTTDALVPPAMRPEARLVGPATSTARCNEDLSLLARLPTDRPIVYVAFGGIISHPPHVYEALVASLAPDEAFFVLALKDLLTEPFVRTLPAHVATVGFAPQMALLRRSALMVHHGGSNSVHECLSLGRPMIVVPLLAEHVLCGRLVEAAGVGAVIDRAEITAARCRELIRPLLAADAPARARAASIADRMGDGAARTAALLTELAETRAPVKGAR